jgi:hypothetical protein
MTGESPIPGFGRMWQRTYQMCLPADRVSPGELKDRFLDLWPDGDVLHADEASVTLATREGHITFSSTSAGLQIVAQAQILMRANDPLDEIGLSLGGHRRQDRIWERTLTDLAARFGLDAAVDTRVICVDRRRRWSRWRQVRRDRAAA